MLESLKQEVYAANISLDKSGLVLFTWGNVSGIDRASGLVVIKPSGIAYDDLTPQDLPVVDLETGKTVEGRYNPSSDTPTHLVLYRAFPEIGGITHTHSVYATSFAQAGRGIRPYGTTHGDYFSTTIPCTRQMIRAEIRGNYEEETGNVIVEALKRQKLSPTEMPAVLVHSHGPFTWGKTAIASAENALLLENVAQMAFQTELLQIAVGQRGGIPMQPDLLDKHFSRKHGPNAYYGQSPKDNQL